MAFTAPDKKEIRRLARLEAAALIRDSGSAASFHVANTFNTTTGRFTGSADATAALNAKIIALDAAEGGDPFA